MENSTVNSDENQFTEGHERDMDAQHQNLEENQKFIGEQLDVHLIEEEYQRIKVVETLGEEKSLTKTLEFVDEADNAELIRTQESRSEITEEIKLQKNNVNVNVPHPELEDTEMVSSNGENTKLLTILEYFPATVDEQITESVLITMDDLVIPPRTEANVRGSLEMAIKGDVLVCEPCDIGNPQAHVARTVVRNEQKIPVKIMNLSWKEVKLKKVETTRIMYHCGMHSHSSLVEGGISSYVDKLGAEDCRLLHRYRALKLYEQDIGQITMNGSTTASLTILGSVDATGSCDGTIYHENGRTWKDVVIMASVKIQARDYEAKVNLNENEISLQGGVTCPFMKGYCFDTILGESVWDIMAVDSDNDNGEGSMQMDDLTVPPVAGPVEQSAVNKDTGKITEGIKKIDLVKKLSGAQRKKELKERKMAAGTFMCYELTSDED
ncbi:unnamed protein product [Phaedon cochleariae]|uniref:Uncharacterized protein n=1 Tax=Phaedon cochleariae TaxID=80249 RepID=A0A9N9SAV0_PHACE|nr:unnamed protein product [Phaedon cochleariae]